MIHLRAAALRPPASDETDGGYPFAVPAVAALRATPLTFDTPLPFLVGENGSGKSAILEGLACAVGSIAIAGEDPSRDPTMAAARALGERLRLTWRARTQRGFFLRAEDFFGYAKYIATLRAGAGRSGAVRRRAGAGDLRPRSGARALSAPDRPAPADRSRRQRDISR